MKRLAAALDQLEAASARLAQAGAEAGDLQEVLALMQDDRSRLASELDAATARAEALQRATREVGERLNGAGAVLRRLLSADAGEG